VRVGEQIEWMKLIPALLLGGMLAVSGWAEDTKPEPYSAELVKRAEAGDAKAQCDLGYSYLNGAGVTKDYKEAVKWYTKSADQGNAEAQVSLGLCYSFGTGVAKDEKEAVKWCMKSVIKGNAKAQCFLGTCYHLGIGVTKNEKEAVKWWRKSAKQGFEPAKKTLEYLKSK